jgi:MFS family permease
MRRRVGTRRIPRRRGAVTGLLVILLGVWGGLIPFVGPYFNYQIGTTSTWDWSIDRFWLSVLPGAVAVLGGLIMLYSTRRSTASFGGLLALAAGLWFIVGPSVSMLWNGGTQATGPAFGDTGTRVLEWIGFFYGTGGLITLFSAYGLGFLAALPVIDEAVPTAAARPPAEPAATPAPAAERVERPATAPPARRRRGFLGRRSRSEPAERR